MSSSSTPVIKHRRLNNQILTTFNNNAKDEKQCLNIINVLNSCINDDNNNKNYPQIMDYILKEIAEYATGILIKCHGKLNIPDSSFICSGFIHYLRGNNFNSNLEYKNELSLFNYKCDDERCTHEVHIFECKGCDRMAHVDKYPPTTLIAIHDEIDIFPYRLCSTSSCDGIYCPKCDEECGVFCNECAKYYCDE